MGLLTRRQFIGAATGLAVVPSLALPASGLSIRPRSDWGSAHPPSGPLENEDVRFLLVHHSAGRNGHTSADVPNILRSWFNFHTGPEKGWNDIAYNFCVDAEGVIWEARQGSIAGSIAGDATGGNQGFSQLICVIGDFNTAEPTAAAVASLQRLLAWLADKHGLDTSPGSKTTFTSRGSNKWAEGVSVTTPIVAGHRDMSATSCPGSNLYSYVSSQLMADVHTVRSGGSPGPVSTTTSSTTTTSSSSTSTTSTTTTSTPTTSPSTTSTTTTVPQSTSTLAPTTSMSHGPTSTLASTTPTPTGTSSTAGPASSTTSLVPEAAGEIGGSGYSPLLTAGAALALIISGAAVWRYRRTNS